MTAVGDHSHKGAVTAESYPGRPWSDNQLVYESTRQVDLKAGDWHPVLRFFRLVHFGRAPIVYPGMKCEGCRTPTKGCTGFCRTCKFARQRGLDRIRCESLLLDTAGGSWWVWDPRGEVLVIGRNTKQQAIIALGSGDLVEAEEA